MTEYSGALEQQTLENDNFRQVLFTAKHAQLVLMCLRPGEDIGDEVHPDVDSSSALSKGKPSLFLTRRRNVRCGTEMPSLFRPGLSTTW